MTVTLATIDPADPAIVVRIDGRPLSWKRPLDRARGGRRTDPDVRSRQDVIRVEVDAALRADGEYARPVWPTGEHLAVEVVSCYPRPARNAADLPAHADVDNLAKIVLDALEGVAYANDRQIVALSTVKGWTDGDGFVEIVLRNVHPADVDPDPTDTAEITVSRGPADA